MSIPIRCFTCGKVIADKIGQYEEEIKSGKKASDVFKNINITRYCCKRMFLGNVDIVDKLIIYSGIKKK